MAKTLKAQLNSEILATYQNGDAMGSPQEVLRRSYRRELEPGAGDFQVDRMYRAERSLASAASENLDLSGGLTDIFGEALTLSKVKAIRVQAHPTNTTNLTVRREGTNGAPIFETLGDGVILEPGGYVEIGSPKAGFTVTAGTGDLVQVVNASGATAKYDVIIIGND